MAATAAQKARNVRKEALKEWLSNKRLVEHVVELAKKIEGLSPESVVSELKQALEDNPDVSAEYVIKAYQDKLEFDLKKYKTSAEINLKLVNKYLGDEKAVENTIELVSHGADGLTDAVLAHIAAGGSTGAAETADSEEQSTSLH